MNSTANICGFDGFAYIEFGAASESSIIPVLADLGFMDAGLKDGVRWMIHGSIRFAVDTRKTSAARNYAEQHGASLSGLAFHVASPQLAYQRAIEFGAKPLPHGLIVPTAYAVEGIGGISFYFVPLDVIKETAPAFAPAYPVDLSTIDHITFNVGAGNRAKWSDFLEKAFGFENVFEAELPVNDSRSITTVMRSPCGGVNLACNEPMDDRSPLHRQMAEFNGEGLQHLAFSTPDIFRLARRLDATSLRPLVVPQMHYDNATVIAQKAQIPMALLRDLNLLIGSRNESGDGWMLQRFTEPALGPSFFEFVQRINFEQGFVQATAQTLLKTMSELSAAA